MLYGELLCPILFGSPKSQSNWKKIVHETQIVVFCYNLYTNVH